MFCKDYSDNMTFTLDDFELNNVEVRHYYIMIIISINIFDFNLFIQMPKGLAKETKNIHLLI